MALYVTGDIHADIRRFLPDRWAVYDLPPLKETDTVLIAGDFGIPWGYGKGSAGTARAGIPSEVDEEKLDALEAIGAMFLYVDGNHENFTALEKYPETVWHGDRVHRLRENVLHLQRGAYYTIEGRSVFTFGGAHSIDRAWRTEGESWWAAENPSDEDKVRAIRTLAAHDHYADIILTHAAPSAFIRDRGMEGRPPVKLHGRFGADQTAEFLGEIRPGLRWKYWFFGHYHSEIADWEESFFGLYKNVIEVK